MRDLIVKTVLITLASIFAALLLTFGALALFSPITLAKVFDSTGGYSSSIRFYEKNYEKTGDIDDLALLTVKINQEIDSELAEKYYEELVSHEQFNEFCKTASGGELSNKQFYLGNYVIVLTRNDKLDKAIEVADKFVNENGYTNSNPYTMVLIEYGDKLTAEQLDLIKNKISTYSQTDKVNVDIAYVENLKSKLK